MELRDVVKDDKQIKLMLQQNDGLRKQYLVLYDLVNIIVDVNQQKFAQLATTARKSSHMSDVCAMSFIDQQS